MAYDKLHENIKAALEMNGFKTRKDPMSLRCEGLRFFIDLAMERNNETYAIEIKSFNSSFLAEFYKMLGQTLIYRRVLKMLNKPHELHTAITRETFRKYFRDPIPNIILKRYHLNIMSIDTESKKIHIHRF